MKISIAYYIRNAMQFKGYTPEYEVQEYCKKYLN